jgi:hypothetical protein
VTRDYINRRTAGDEDESRRVAHALGSELYRRHEAGEIAGYFISVVHSPEEAADEMVPEEFFDGVSGKFPFLYLRLNYGEGCEGTGSVEPLVHEAGFEFVF